MASFNNQSNVHLKPALYYVGLSSTDGTIDAWTYSATTPPYKRHFNFGFNDAVVNTLGTASNVGSALRLTKLGSESGVAYYPQPIYAHVSFTSALIWSLSGCDAANNGADG